MSPFADINSKTSILENGKYVWLAIIFKYHLLSFFQTLHVSAFDINPPPLNVASIEEFDRNDMFSVCTGVACGEIELVKAMLCKN